MKTNEEILKDLQDLRGSFNMKKRKKQLRIKPFKKALIEFMNNEKNNISPKNAINDLAYDNLEELKDNLLHFGIIDIDISLKTLSNTICKLEKEGFLMVSRGCASWAPKRKHIILVEKVV